MFTEIELKGVCIKCGKPIIYKGMFSGENQYCDKCKKELNSNINYT